MDVLRTAAKAFADQGFSRATLGDIASVLNMTRAALYYYAESKDELLRACRKIATDALDESLDNAERLPTGIDRIRAYCRDHVAVGCNDFGRCFVLIDNRDLSEVLRQQGHDWRRGRNRRIEAMFRAGMRDGSFVPGDPVLLRRLLFAIINAVPLWVDSTTARATARAADQALEIFLMGVTPRP